MITTSKATCGGYLYPIHISTVLVSVVYIKNKVAFCFSHTAANQTSVLFEFPFSSNQSSKVLKLKIGKCFSALRYHAIMRKLHCVELQPVLFFLNAQHFCQNSRCPLKSQENRPSGFYFFFSTNTLQHFYEWEKMSIVLRKRTGAISN